MYVVMIGCLSEGWASYGPFDSFDKAEKWADTSAPMWETWVMQVLPPKAYRED